MLDAEEDQSFVGFIIFLGQRRGTHQLLSRLVAFDSRSARYPNHVFTVIVLRTDNNSVLPSMAPVLACSYPFCLLHF